MEGFEPPVPSRVHRISSAARSTTLAHLLIANVKGTDNLRDRQKKVRKEKAGAVSNYPFFITHN